MGTPNSVVVADSRLSNKDQKKIEKLRAQIPFYESRGNTVEVLKIREQITSITSKVIVADDETAESTEVADAGDIGMGEEEDVEELEDKEWEEFREERFRILADVECLKRIATFFLHPEAAVKVDPCATARCYFDRASAPVNPELLEEQEWQEFLEERRQVLKDAKSLQQWANYFLHPETPVQVDRFATARCYFDRASAPLNPEVVEEQDWDEFAAERRRILEDAKNLKQLAGFYYHPENPVEVDAFARARCYFDRPSAPVDPDVRDEQEWEEFTAERRRILEDAKNLKQLAGFYHHPENPVSVDAFARARCYFDRASAPVDPEVHDEQEWQEFREERRRVLEDAQALKQTANFYLHPEAPVKVDGFAGARCYFDRASAPVDSDLLEDHEWEEFREERCRVLEDAKNLKKFAGFYLHPEAPVEVEGFATGRCYFDRASAPTGEL